MSTEAFEAAKANARDVLDAAFRAYSPTHAAQCREAEGPAMCGAIEDAIANALVLVRAGLAPQPGELATLPLEDFLGAAQALNDSVRVLGVYAAPEWAELSEDGQRWVAALLRETLAHVPGELERLREEVAFWRSDLAARLLFDTGHLRAERERGNTDAAVTIELRIRSNLAAYTAAEAGDWHNRCDICGEFVRPGEPFAAGEDVSGHWACLSDAPAPAGRDLAPGVDLAVRVAMAREALDEGKAPAPRPLMVPCPDCHDGFVSFGDRHTDTRQDRCKTCHGTREVPARTGETPEASAPPVNVNSEGTEGKALPETGKVFPEDQNEASTAPAGSFLDPVPVLYRNWRQETRVRQLAPTLAPDGPMKWCAADEHHGEGWRVRCLDVESEEQHRRWYPLAGVLAWGLEAIAERQREQAAARTLEGLGFTHEGAELWKPPLGPAPDFEAADRRRGLAEQLRALCESKPHRDFDEQLLLGDAARALEAVPLLGIARWSAAARLAVLEDLFAEDRRARGLKPFGRLEDQLRDLLVRAREAQA